MADYVYVRIIRKNHYVQSFANKIKRSPWAFAHEERCNTHVSVLHLKVLCHAIPGMAVVAYLAPWIARRYNGNRSAIGDHRQRRGRLRRR